MEDQQVKATERNVETSKGVVKFSIQLRYEATDGASHFIFKMHAVQRHCQSVVNEALHISQPITPVIDSDPSVCTRYMQLTADAGAPSTYGESSVWLRAAHGMH